MRYSYHHNSVVAVVVDVVNVVVIVVVAFGANLPKHKILQTTDDSISSRRLTAAVGTPAGVLVSLLDYGECIIVVVVALVVNALLLLYPGVVLYRVLDLMEMFIAVDGHNNNNSGRSNDFTGISQSQDAGGRSSEAVVNLDEGCV